MAAFKHPMTDMGRTMADAFPAALSDAPTYYPICICLDENDLAKLDLEDDCEPGDTIHLMAMASVKSVTKRDGTCRIELQVEKMSVESEDEEDVEDE